MDSCNRSARYMYTTYLAKHYSIYDQLSGSHVRYDTTSLESIVFGHQCCNFLDILILQGTDADCRYLGLCYT